MTKLDTEKNILNTNVHKLAHGTGHIIKPLQAIHTIIVLKLFLLDPSFCIDFDT